MNSIITLMNKKLLPVIIIIVLIVGFYGAYRVYKHFARLAAAPVTQTATGTQEASPVTSLKDLITQGIAQSCTFSNAGTTGTVYVSGGKVRGDFSTSTTSATTQSHMIVMNNTSYIWMEGQKTGFKMSYDPNATPGTSSSAPNGSFDASANMNYNCSTWVVDASQFTLPAGVTFTSFAAPTQTAPAAGTSSGSSSNSSQCSYCNALSGADKTKCLVALNCQ